MSKPCIRKWTLCVCSLESLTRLNSSTWAAKWFKRLVAYAKCNRDSYERDKELEGDEDNLKDFRKISNLEFSDMEDDVDISVLTMEQYIALIPDEIKLGIVNPKIGDDVKFEIKCKLYKKVHIFYTGLDIPTCKILDSNGFIPLMTPTQSLESIQVMANHSHDWYDETTTRERINDVLDNVDAIHENVKGKHLAKEYHLKKEDGAIKHSRYMEFLEETIIKFCEDTIKK
ncbi:hypothetical protein Tco_0122532 [Tanacetum coccineum]